MVLAAAAACIFVAVCFLTNPKRDGVDVKGMIPSGEKEAAQNRAAAGEKEAGQNGDEAGEKDDMDVSGENEMTAAIRTAILEENEGGHGDVDFACCDFVCLEAEPGISETKEPASLVTYYGWAMYEAYQISEEGIVCVEGSHLPVALTFAQTEGDIRLIEYWKPREGSYFVPDVREKFPSRIAEDGVDSQKYVLLQIQSCYRQAVAGSGLDTDAVIRGLLDTICSKPTTSSNPKDYIDAHIGEYRELLYYGTYTLNYAETHVREQAEADLAAVVLSLACEEILEAEGGRT